MAGLLSRFGAALVARAEGVAERFIAQSSAELRAAARASNEDPDPTWMRVRAAIEDEASGKRPPTEEYQDFPVSVWQDWTIGSIRGAVQSHVNGAFSQAAILVESMLADDRIQTATNGRIKGVTKCQPVFEPNGSKKAVKELEKLWPEIIPEELLDQLLTWSIFLGFALCEVIWETRDDRWVPRLKLWHPLYIYYRIDLRKYVAISTEGSIEIDPDDPKWFLFTPWGSYRGWLRGAVRSCSIPWVVRQFALRDWGRFSEVHGLPIKKLIVPSQAPAEDKARFMASIARLGSESQFMLPQQSTDTGGMGPGSFDVQLLEAKDRAWEAFPGLIHQAERSITLAIRGTNLTTELDGGSFAAANVHRDEDSDYSISDRRKLASAIKAQLLRPFCLYNYGSADVAPELKLVAPESDQESEAKVWQSVSAAVVALEQQQWPIDRKQIADKYTIPLLEGVDPNEKPEPAAPPVPASREPANENAQPPRQVAAVAGKSATKAQSLPRAEFDEDNVTRDESGKFSSGGGGGSGGGGDGDDGSNSSSDGDDDAGDDDEPSGPRERTREELIERHATAVERRDEAVAARDEAKADADDEIAAAMAEVDGEVAALDAYAASAKAAREGADQRVATSQQAAASAKAEIKALAKAEKEDAAAHEVALDAADTELERALEEVEDAYATENDAILDRANAAFDAENTAFEEAHAPSDDDYEEHADAFAEKWGEGGTAWEAQEAETDKLKDAHEERVAELEAERDEKKDSLQSEFDSREEERSDRRIDLDDQLDTAKSDLAEAREAVKSLRKIEKAAANPKRRADLERLKTALQNRDARAAEKLAARLENNPAADTMYEIVQHVSDAEFAALPTAGTIDAQTVSPLRQSLGKAARAERAVKVHEREVSRTQRAIDRDGDGRTGAAEERDDKKEAS